MSTRIQENTALTHVACMAYSAFMSSLGSTSQSYSYSSNPVLWLATLLALRPCKGLTQDYQVLCKALTLSADQGCSAHASSSLRPVNSS